MTGPMVPALAKTGMTEDGAWLGLTLADHAADVAAMFRALLECENIRRRLASLAGLPDLDPVICDRLAVLAALHDAGKVTARFQRRIRGDVAAGGGHIGPFWAALAQESPMGPDRERKQALQRALRLSDLSTWFSADTEDEDGDPLTIVFTAVLAHHGNIREILPDRRDWERLADGYDPMAALDDLTRRVWGWFPAAFTATPPLALPVTGRFAHGLAGLMVWADQLGSDLGAFPLMNAAEQQGRRDDRFAWSCRQAVRVLAERHLDATARQAAAARLTPDFAGFFPQAAARGWTPRPMQAAMLALDATALSPGAVLVLEAETGSGKTEAAVALFLSLLRAGRVDGLYFALPTRASALQVQGRITDLLRAALGPGAAPPVGLAVPGYLRVDEEEGQRLPGYRIAWPDGDQPRLDDRRWAAAHSSRYLAGPVMVGTIDQLLLGGLPVRHASFRSASMLRQLLVIDEVHASDPYMTALLAHMLDQQRAAGGLTLLMSATLGAQARARLTKGPCPDLETALAIPYPCLHGAPFRPAAAAPDRNITMEVHDPATLDAVLQRAIAAAGEGAHILVLRNTVRAAVATQEALERLCPDPSLLFRVKDRAAPHHARFAAEDRRLLDRALERDFAGERSPRGRIAVTTQTAEQSLDIDADLLITDLCPADVLLQRLGRLHRHRRDNRPAGLDMPRALVLAPGMEDLAGCLPPDGRAKAGAAGIGSVYANLLALAATLEALKANPVWLVPSMNRALVEAITHHTALGQLAARLDAAVGGSWAAHHRYLYGRAAAERTVADHAVLDWRRWDAGALVNDGDGVVTAATRLGERDRRVVLPSGTIGPFGEPITSLTIPAHMLRDVPMEVEPMVEAVTEGVRLSLGRVVFLYSRIGLVVRLVQMGKL